MNELVSFKIYKTKGVGEMVDDIAVDIKALNQQFGKKIILQDINFSVKQGEILGLLGPSGSESNDALFKSGSRNWIYGSG
jgi:ABC-type polysaccharide/polyol phosphate transport system ATPase subunit